MAETGCAQPEAWRGVALESAADARRLFVLLHGWGQDGRSLLPLARQLRGYGGCWLPDLPGFGRTPMLAEGAGSEAYAAALLRQPVIAKARAAGRKIVLIGHSFGARVALQAAAAEPALAGALVLIAGAGLKRRRGPLFRLRAFVLRGIGRLLKAVDRRFGSALFAAYASRAGSADYRRAGPMRATLVRVVNEDLLPLAARIRCPCLLLYGAQDRETPPEFGERYAKAMADARLVVFDRYGHLDILTAGVFRCAEEIIRFLDEREL